MIKASIDLGSNTFQLLIVELNENFSIKRLVEESFAVKLFFDQTYENLISQLAIQRALEAINNIQYICNQYKIEYLQVAATSALRDALNGKELSELFFNKLNKIEAKSKYLEVISGEKEAQIIANAQLFWLKKELKSTPLILDIGGGSVEFAYYNANKNLIVKSLPLGVARLIHEFQITFDQTLSIHKIQKLNKYLYKKLQFLGESFKTSSNVQLIGVSGTFETNAILLNKNIAKQFAAYTNVEFQNLHQNLLLTTSSQRAKNHKIPNVRKDMILIANILINNILEIIEIDEILYSGFDLSYGLLL